MERLDIALPPEYVAALERPARAEDVSRGQVIRDAIRRDLKRRETAKTPVRADERLVAPLRALLAEDFAYARD
ncbi:CopG family transcriptional regulator [Rhodosalinus sediminis]|uniref:ribbon-helix-helix domain-containing protein n=1 Tax=Rhodosalinus sediminis TaxID=1940533 RepID=UPI001EFDBF50|nr:CopG family transcriptional regulator [Rhodosalinus sediminis]